MGRLFDWMLALDPALQKKRPEDDRAGNNEQPERETAFTGGGIDLLCTHEGERNRKLNTDQNLGTDD